MEVFVFEYEFSVVQNSSCRGKLSRNSVADKGDAVTLKGPESAVYFLPEKGKCAVGKAQVKVVVKEVAATNTKLPVGFKALEAVGTLTVPVVALGPPST